MSGAVSIAEESPDQPAVIALLKAGDAYAAALYPAESNHGSALDELLQPNVTFRLISAVAAHAGLIQDSNNR